MDRNRDLERDSAAPRTPPRSPARRPTRAGAIAVVVATVALLSSCGWFSYGFDGANSRTNTTETAISPANAATLVEKWRVDGIKGVTSTPAVVGDTVVFGAWDGKVRAVDTDDGSLRWVTTVTAGIGVTGAMVDDSPLLYDGKVIIGDGAGRLHALDAHTGALLWTTILDSHANARIFSSPVIAEGRVIVGVGSYELAFEKPEYTFKGSVVSLDPATGAVQWRFFTTNDDAVGGAGASVWSTAAIDTERDLLYIGVGQSYEEPAGPYTDSLIALDYQTGALEWHRQFTDGDVYRIFRTPINGPDADVGAAPNLFTIGDRDVVGVGDKAGVYSVLDRTTGETVWARQLTVGSHLGGIMLTSAVHDGVVYASSNIMAGSVIDFANPANTSVTFALDADDGSILWQTAVPRASFGALTLANGVLYQPTITGSFYLFDASTGAIIDTLTPMAGAQLGGGASVADGVVFAPYGMWFFLEAAGQQGGLVAYELPGT